MRFIWFFLTWTAIVMLGYWYVGRRIVPAMAHFGFPSHIGWITIVVLCLMPLGGFMMVLQRQHESVGLDILLWCGYLSLGLFSLLLAAFFLRDIGGWLHQGFTWLFTKPSEVTTDETRRQFLFQSINLSVAGVCTAVAGYGVFKAHHDPVVETAEIPLKNLPKNFDGFRIVQFSDLHVGPTIKRDFVERVTNHVMRLKPDLVAFTGDLVDGTVSWLREDVIPLKQLQAPHGVFFVTGNHEYYSGAQAWCDEAKRLGFDVLLNEHRIIHRDGQHICLAGITDYGATDFIPGHLSDPLKAIHGTSPEYARILLAHQPKSAPAAAAAGFDLQLSGHTHGGQFFPGNLLAAVAQPYLKGLHRHDNMWVYVNRGTGYWGPPMRIGSPPEITVITLRCA